MFDKTNFPFHTLNPFCFLAVDRLKFHFLPLFHIFLFVLLITPSFIIIKLFIVPDACQQTRLVPTCQKRRGFYCSAYILTMTNKLSIKYGSSSTTLQIRSSRCMSRCCRVYTAMSPHRTLPQRRNIIIMFFYWCDPSVAHRRKCSYLHAPYYYILYSMYVPLYNIQTIFFLCFSIRKCFTLNHLSLL